MTEHITRKCRIGLTGGIGSGKSTVAGHFERLGATVIDADALSRALTATGGLALAKILERFGPEAIAANGAMDREWMRARVFADAGVRTSLEAILHPMIRQQTDEALAAARGPYIVLDIPLLFEGGNWQQRVDQVVVVDCPETTQVQRVMSRSQLTETQVLAIMAQQVKREFRLKHADHVVDNSGQSDALAAQVQALHVRFCSLVCYS
jgi:dephospho-CoA kinase